MKETQLIRKYVTAIFEISKDKKNIDKSYEELLFVCNLINDNDELKQFISDTKVAQVAKKNVFKELFSNKVSEDVLTFLFLIFEKGRQSILPFLSDEFRSLMDADKGLKEAVVTSAIELDGKNRSKIEEYVSSIIKSAYELKFDIDSNLIGGFLLRIEDKIYDRSVKGRLNSIKNEIIK